MDFHALIELLAQNGLIQGSEVARLAEIADDESADLFTALEAAGCGGREEILKTIADSKGLDFLDLRDAAIPPRLLKELPPDVMRIYRCFPTFVAVDLCKVCMVDPLDDVARAELSRLLGRPVEVVVADPDLVDLTVEAALKGSLENSPLVDGSRSAPVAASLGSARAETPDPRLLDGGGDFRWAWSLSLLAVAAVALAALYLGQKKSLALSEELRLQLEDSNRNIEFSALAAQKELREIAGQLEKLKELLEQNEVDAIALQQFENDMKRMEGIMESMQKLESRGEDLNRAKTDADAPGQ